MILVVAPHLSVMSKENLLNEASARFQPGRYGNRGEIVDGWETRRRRGEPGGDWVIVRLGVGGIVSTVDVDRS
jgi:allantoicase